MHGFPLYVLIGSFLAVGPAHAASDIEIPGAVRCFHALEAAIHASQKADDLLDSYPRPWAVAPGSFGSRKGAWLFREDKPDWSSFYTEENFDPNLHGFFAEFLGRPEAIEAAAAQGHPIYNGDARDALAEFLIGRIDKIFATYVSQKNVPKEAPAPLSSSDRRVIGNAVGGALGLMRGVASEAPAPATADPQLLWPKIIAGGKKGLPPQDRAIFEKVESWKARFAKWSREHEGSAPYPDGEPTAEENEKYGHLLDRVEAGGVAKLAPAERNTWRKFKTPSATGESIRAVDAQHPEESRREQIVRENQAVLDAVDLSAAGFNASGDVEAMDLTQMSLGQGLAACKEVRGETRISGKAAALLEKLNAGVLQSDPPARSGAEAGGAAPH